LESISIIIPAYNEERRLPSTLDAVIGYLHRTGFPSVEVLVVNDGSRDETGRVALDYASRHPEVRVLDNPGNRGKGYSVRHGMLEAKGDWILFSDADLSAPIEELEKLLAAGRERGAQVVIGSRALDRSLIKVHQSLFRENAGRIFNLCMRLVTGLPFWDTQCGFKLFAARAAREIFRRQKLDGFSFDVEALFLARKLGFRTTEVPVRWSHAEGTKVSMFSDSLRMFTGLFQVRWNHLRGLYK